MPQQLAALRRCPEAKPSQAKPSQAKSSRDRLNHSTEAESLSNRLASERDGQESVRQKDFCVRVIRMRRCHVSISAAGAPNARSQPTLIQEL